MAKLFGTVMLIWLACIPVRVSAHDAYDDCGRCTSSCPSRSSSRSSGTCRTRTPSGITSRISPSHPDARPRDRAGARRDN